MIKNTLFYDYLKARNGSEIVESEDAFITYTIMGAECYIADTYVRPEKRRTGAFKALQKELLKIAAEKGCAVITGHVYLLNQDYKQTLMAAFNCGFEIVETRDGVFKIAMKVGG